MSSLSSLFSSSALLFAANFIGQIILLVSLPMVSFFYAPADFGRYSNICSIAFLLSVLMPLRYEIGIVALFSHRAARQLVWASCVATLAIAILYLAITNVWSPSPLHRYDAYFVTILAVFMAFLNIATSVQNRYGHFHRLAASALAQRTLLPAGMFLFAAFSPSMLSLFFAKLISLVCGLAFLCRWNRLPERPRLRSLVYPSRLFAVRHYRRHAIAGLVRTCITTASRESVIILLAALGYFAEAAYYALIRTLLWAPGTLISSTFGPILFLHACRQSRADVRVITFPVFLALLALAASGCTYLFLLADPLVAFGFAASWAPLADILPLLLPSAFLLMASDWASRIFDATNRQRLFLTCTTPFDLLAVIVFSTLLLLNHQPHAAIFAHSMLMAMGLLASAIAQFRLLAFSRADLLKLALATIGSVTLTALGIKAGALIFQGPILLLLAVLPTVLIGAGLVLSYIRLRRQFKIPAIAQPDVMAL